MSARGHRALDRIGHGRGTALVAVTPKSPEAFAHDRVVGRAVAVLLAVAAVTALVVAVRRLARKVAEERADDALAEAFAELDPREPAAAAAPSAARARTGPSAGGEP